MTSKKYKLENTKAKEPESRRARTNVIFDEDGIPRVIEGESIPIDQTLKRGVIDALKNLDYAKRLAGQWKSIRKKVEQEGNNDKKRALLTAYIGAAEWHKYEFGVNNYPNLDNAINEAKAILYDMQEKKKKGTSINNPYDWINPERGGAVKMHEKNIPTLIKEWKSGEKIEYCAAYCNYLFKKNYFNPHTLVTAKKFALVNYGVNLDSSLKKLRKKVNTELLEEKTNVITRKILGRQYGKMECPSIPQK